MNKVEFLDVLENTLRGEVDPDIIEQSIKFYDQYIETRMDGNEAKILNELGDPRLIAKTIIETEKVAKQKDKYSSNNYNSENKEAEDGPSNNRKRGSSLFSFNMKWYHKVLTALIIVMVFIVIIYLGRFLLYLLFSFGVPILLILLLLVLFRRR